MIVRKFFQNFKQQLTISIIHISSRDGNLALPPSLISQFSGTLLYYRIINNSLQRLNFANHGNLQFRKVSRFYSIDQMIISARLSQFPTSLE
ncbi:hypothetical protein FGO68_gene16096 [Halteria grandinella]|uniref:Uncharacterized protein n=1 Tax=Halteria grandinella TaxID=5974 RepID=A0A8J8NCQ3_HALGN|nr:hypothetical protein FGO68_gene16096 [Halteria grandinella]